MSTGGVSMTGRRIVVFGLLFGCWLALSGHFDPLHVGLGVVSAGLVAAASSDLLLPATATPRAAVAGRFVGYLPWLLWEVVLANLHVVRLVLWRSDVRPQVVRFTTSLHGDLARVVFATSITLTPGTVTMDVDGDEFIVHAISDQAAEGLLDGAMERRVARVFGEPGPPPGASGDASA